MIEFAKILSVYFIGLTVISLVMLFFSYKVYRNNKETSKGWGYLAIYGVLMAVTGIIGALTAIPSIIGTIFGILFDIILVGTIIYLVLFLTAFRKDLSLGLDFLNRRNAFIFAGVIFALILVWNIVYMHSLTILGLRIILILVMGLCLLLLLAIPYKMMVYTKMLQWKIIFISLVCMMLNFVYIMGFAGCCSVGGPLGAEPVCQPFQGSFERIIPAPCPMFTIDLILPALVLGIVGNILFATGMGIIYRMQKK